MAPQGKEMWQFAPMAPLLTTTNTYFAADTSTATVMLEFTAILYYNVLYQTILYCTI